MGGGRSGGAARVGAPEQHELGGRRPDGPRWTALPQGHSKHHLRPPPRSATHSHRQAEQMTTLTRWHSLKVPFICPSSDIHLKSSFHPF